MAGKQVLPRVHVMVLCDEIELRAGEDEAFNLSGVRARLRAPSFPFTQPQLCVYMQLTGHVRTARCHVEVIRADTEGIVFSSPPQVTALRGPLNVLHLGFWLRNCKFARPGLYYVQAYCDQRLICERSLSLQQA